MLKSVVTYILLPVSGRCLGEGRGVDGEVEVANAYLGQSGQSFLDGKSVPAHVVPTRTHTRIC